MIKDHVQKEMTFSFTGTQIEDFSLVLVLKVVLPVLLVQVDEGENSFTKPCLTMQNIH